MARSKFISLDSLSFQEFDENSELIPLMTTEDEKEINNELLPETLPILSLRNSTGRNRFKRSQCVPCCFIQIPLL